MEINHEEQGMSDANFHQDPRHDLDHPDHQLWKEVQEIGADSAETERWLQEQEAKSERNEARGEPESIEDRKAQTDYPDRDSVERVHKFVLRHSKHHQAADTGNTRGAPIKGRHTKLDIMAMKDRGKHKGKIEPGDHACGKRLIPARALEIFMEATV